MKRSSHFLKKVKHFYAFFIKKNLKKRHKKKKKSCHMDNEGTLFFFIIGLALIGCGTALWYLKEKAFSLQKNHLFYLVAEATKKSPVLGSEQAIPENENSLTLKSKPSQITEKVLEGSEALLLVNLIPMEWLSDGYYPSWAWHLTETQSHK